MRMYLSKSLIALCILLSGCSAQQRFDVPIDIANVTFLFYNSLQEAEQKCGRVDDAGCTICTGTTIKHCVVHLVKERCMLDHEMDHVIFGDFHKGKDALCKERAGG